MNDITDEQKKQIEDLFVNRMKHQGIKFESSAYYKEQAAFFAGVMSTLVATIPGYIPSPKWSICCMSDRAIVDKY